MFRLALARVPTLAALRCAPRVASRTPLTLRTAIRAPSNITKKYYAESFTTGDEVPPEVANLSAEKYHAEADEFLESLQDDLEALSQKYPESVPEVELTQGVMQLELGGLGSYVINKQPPNKQIWLASPISGPNRFDFYNGEWVSLRDGTKLLEVLNKEVNDAVEEEEVNLLQ
ncbi:YFH1 (YDL120W) [Zygosaccharomyces parabailii]|uniref:ferroxidase n=1 Tax=Zygosaccharomyces bailii (strain CLIB 213 / ATCC 58445 / CBS 680 / BCRC 21525 / NBRC 1098 / NCYC 1416 / NRRL Y-2227) TaxID=1333698 RepID=A0A8J2T7M2_ZYGB2|nr:YFH1 (YDL120W) [Zygosaccharomyces parabailii]CDF89503.1 ZYBA0S04-05820g1_1 [Zygosaccharomyces bailii CLIB 213]CDH08469.1 related to Frataxin homolog, mitochondrial [Zygosaccharomyces bailii ISA1307]